jgi:hypothetical protein
MITAYRIIELHLAATLRVARSNRYNRSPTDTKPHRRQRTNVILKEPIMLRRFILAAVLTALTLPAAAQFDDGGGLPPGAAPGAAPGKEKHADDPIKIAYPKVDTKLGRITLPAAFWNQKMTNWVEVAMCGRPSDFLHETIVCITSTKEIMMQSMRAAGFHDADAWVASVHDFPRIRGDRFIILLQFPRNGKQETYSLDELLCYQGWGVSAGPYGWMFKGDPEREGAATPPATAPAAPKPEDDKDPAADRTKILRDDPQIALVFKGIQHLSKSFADHPIAYDDWVYPMMRYGRNYRLLPSEIYDSNGEVPVTMILQKCTEEQFITETARVWHDPAARDYILKQLPTARQIDKDKAELWSLLPELKKLRNIPDETRDVVHESALFGKVSVLAANIEKGYATLDCAWARWACDHPVYETTDDQELAELKEQTKSWREHMELKLKSAEQNAIGEKAAVDLKQLEHQPDNDDTKKQKQKLTGIELEARSTAMLADIVQPRAYWKYEQGRVDPKTDPRTDWIHHINAQVELIEAKTQVGNTGLSYGRALQSAAPNEVATAQKAYAAAVVKMTIADLQVRLADLDFEISKREGFEDDPDLPRLRTQRKELETQLKAAQATTQPATMP